MRSGNLNRLARFAERAGLSAAAGNGRQREQRDEHETAG